MEQQLRQQLEKLKGEILLAERTLSKLQEDIEQHTLAKGKALAQFDEQIKNKKKEVDLLTEEGKRLQTVIHLQNLSLEELEKERNRIEQESLQKEQAAISQVQGIYDNAKNAEKAVNDREENVTKREFILKQQEHSLIDEQEKLLTDKQQVEVREALLDQKRLSIEKEGENAKQILAQTQELLDDMNRQLFQKQTESKHLDEVIIQKSHHADSIGLAAAEKLKEVERRESVVAGKEQLQHEKDQELIEKELWLADREASLKRAYTETIQRGGRIDA